MSTSEVTGGTGLRASRLLAVELTRLRWRRAVVVLLAIGVLLPVVLLVVLAVQTRPLSGADLAQVQADPSFQRSLRQCERRPENFGLDDAASCTATVTGEYGRRQPLDPRSELASGVAGSTAVVSALILLVAGATFAGHDWTSGSMSNQLLFDPRRGRVWAAKALAVSGVAAAYAVALLLGVWGVTCLLAHHRGIPLTDGVGLDGVQQSLRAAGLATAMALGGYALTMLLRNTVATLGVVFAVAVLGGILVAVIGGEGSGRWQPQNNAAAIIRNDAEYYTPDPQCPPGGYCASIEHHLTARQGAAYGAPFLVLILAGSVLSFRRRDVP